MSSRRRKTTYQGAEWRRIFAQVAKECSMEAKRRGIRFQDCVRERLTRYRR
jgi:hypothetical protein